MNKQVKKTNKTRQDKKQMKNKGMNNARVKNKLE